jgi:hypothetical protein
VPHQPSLPGVLDHVQRLTDPHRAGHRCIDGNWWNPNAGSRQHCPVYTRLQEVADTATALRDSVHEAAHDTAAATAVAEGMTGLVMADLDPEDREGWVLTARMAIEALAIWLDIDHVLEARRAATLARLDAAGLPHHTD